MFQLTPVEQILLICARLELSPVLSERLRECVSGAIPWDQLLLAARRNFIDMLLRKHLLQHAADKVPAATLLALDQLRLKNAMRVLEIIRIHKELSSQVFTATTKHVFIKGATLATQYYADVYLRQYRDIDVLVDDKSLYAAGSELLRRGYRIENPEWQKFKVPDLAAFCRYTAALEMRSPSGILVELHRTLDNTGCVFPVQAFLERRLGHTLSGGRVQVLPATDLLVYLCFHHSRHKWSSLHWCADLDAIGRAPKFDQAQLNHLAKRLGLAATVENAWRLHQELETLALDGRIDPQQGSLFTADCLAALRRSLDAGLVAAPDHSSEPDFPYAWQKTTGYRWRFQWSRVHPTANDFNAWPLPLRWHWLYYLLKPWRVAKSRWPRRANATVGP